jgi:hypothetical protein
MMAILVYPLWIFFARTSRSLWKRIKNCRKRCNAFATSNSKKQKPVYLVFTGRWILWCSDWADHSVGVSLFFPKNYSSLFYFAFIPGIIAVLLIFLIKEKKEPVSTLEKGNFFSFLKYWERCVGRI